MTLSAEQDIEHYFRAIGGKIQDGFASINSESFYTDRGTPYLKNAGVVMLAKPSVFVGGIRGFTSGFSQELLFDSYADDPVALSPGTQLAKMAGQVCYMSLGPNRTTNERAPKYFENIKSSGHGSVLEHASYSFLLYGISRSATHELVRHRAGTAFSQTSQRYVDGKVLRFVERSEYQNNDLLHRLFEEEIDDAAKRYATTTSMLLQEQQGGNSWLTGESKTDLRKRVQQVARASLPNETEAPIVFSANSRSLRHIIEMRASVHAETEIRNLFFRIFLCMALAEPILFEDYSVSELSDGTKVVETIYRKV
jgi:thymidylate synthase (FAD)